MTLPTFTHHLRSHSGFSETWAKCPLRQTLFYVANVGASALVKDIQSIVAVLAVLCAYEIVQTYSLMISASQLPSQSRLPLNMC